MEALRKKEISANKAAKVYKIPSSTLYKIARKEGIELAQPFNAVATAWNQVREAAITDSSSNGQVTIALLPPPLSSSMDMGTFFC